MAKKRRSKKQIAATKRLVAMNKGRSKKRGKKSGKKILVLHSSAVTKPLIIRPS
jgi:hypothetical protein